KHTPTKDSIIMMVEEAKAKSPHLAEYLGEVDAICDMKVDVEFVEKRCLDFLKKAEFEVLISETLDTLEKKGIDAAAGHLAEEARRINEMTRAAGGAEDWDFDSIWSFESKRTNIIPKVLIAGTHMLHSGREKRGKTYWLIDMIGEWLGKGVVF